MIHWGWAVLAFFLGGVIGVISACLIAAAGRADEIRGVK